MTDQTKRRGSERFMDEDYGPRYEGKDDPREVGWAERQIKALSQRITEIQREIIAEHERRIADLEAYSVTVKTHTELQHRVAALEGHPRRAEDGVVQARRYEITEDRISSEPVFSPPIGGKGQWLSDDLEPVNTSSGPPDGWVQAEDGSWTSRSDKGSFLDRRDANEASGGVVPLKTLDQSAIRTREIALAAAARRVREYLVRCNFANKTIEDVINAVQGVKPEDNTTKDAPLPRRSPMTACPGSLHCWAGHKPHFHDGVGVVHTIDHTSEL